MIWLCITILVFFLRQRVCKADVRRHSHGRCKSQNDVSVNCEFASSKNLMKWQHYIDDNHHQPISMAFLLHNKWQICQKHIAAKQLVGLSMVRLMVDRSEEHSGSPVNTELVSSDRRGRRWSRWWSLMGDSLASKTEQFCTWMEHMELSHQTCEASSSIDLRTGHGDASTKHAIWGVWESFQQRPRDQNNKKYLKSKNSMLLWSFMIWCNVGGKKRKGILYFSMWLIQFQIRLVKAALSLKLLGRGTKDQVLVRELHNIYI